MPDAKISALSAASVAAVANELVINEAGTSKKITITQLVTLLQTLGMARVKKLTAVHSISSATATKLTDLDMTLEAGTYTFDYYLIVRSSTAGDGIMVGLNFSTGTAAVKTMLAFWADASGSLLAETHVMDDEGVKGTGFISGMASKTYSTTAPLMGTTVGVATTAADIPMRITGVVVVTVQGNIELWHGSESTNATSVEAGSSLVVVRTA